MDNRIITALFREGECVAFTSPVYQYNYGQILKIEGIELPSIFEVQFANEGEEESTTSIGQNNQVDIPDMFFESGKGIRAWIYLHDTAKDGETVYQIMMPVIERAEPSDIEPIPVQQDVITQAIAALNEAVDDCEEAVSHYPKIDSETGNWTVWDGEEEDWSDTGVHAQGEQGEPGTPGADGADGQDGFSPIATVTKSGSTATITITDKNGTTTAEVSDGDASDKMDKNNPTGTGSFSLNRRANTEIGNYSFVEGSSCEASGDSSHAEGYRSRALGSISHAEGFQTIAWTGEAHSEGSSTQAHHHASHAEGKDSDAYGVAAHAEGEGTYTSGANAHAEGYMTFATGDSSHAQGYRTYANSANQFAFGKFNIADDDNTYAEIVGNGTSDNARSNARTLDWDGNEVLAGNLIINGTPINDNHAARKVDVDAKMNKSNPKCIGSFSMNVASGVNVSNGSASIGSLNQPTGSDCICIGYQCKATFMNGVAIGMASESNQFNAIAIGNNAKAECGNAIAIGQGVIANGQDQLVLGRYNVETPLWSSVYAEIFGNGTAMTRSNARTLDWNGNEWLAGKLTIAGTPTGNNDVVRMIDIAGKQDTLTAGDRISIANNVISASLPWKDVSGTLTAGSTSITLSDSLITTDSTIEVFCDVDGIAEPSKAVSTGSITLTFAEAQAQNMGVKVRVS